MNTIRNMQEKPSISYEGKCLKCVNKHLDNSVNYRYKNCRLAFINSNVGKCHFTNCDVVVLDSTVNDIWTFIDCKIIGVKNSILKDVIISNSNFNLIKSRFHNIRLTNGSKHKIVDSTMYETLNNEPKDNTRKLAPIVHYQHSYSPITCGLYVENDRIM